MLHIIARNSRCASHFCHCLGTESLVQERIGNLPDGLIASGKGNFLLRPPKKGLRALAILSVAHTLRLGGIENTALRSTQK